MAAPNAPASDLATRAADALDRLAAAQDALEAARAQRQNLSATKAHVATARDAATTALDALARSCKPGSEDETRAHEQAGVVWRSTPAPPADLRAWAAAWRSRGAPTALPAHKPTGERAACRRSLLAAIARGDAAEAWRLAADYAGLLGHTGEGSAALVLAMAQDEVRETEAALTAVRGAS
jgi:hypothetical protein